MYFAYHKSIKYCMLLLVASLVCACDIEEDKKKEAAHNVTYDGPAMEIKDVNTLYSEKAEIKINMKAPVQWEYKNGDRKFPKGVYIEFFEKKGQPATSYLRSNWAMYDKAKNLYTVTGDVISENRKEHKKLKTEKLNWNPATREVYTDVFVRMETQTEVLTGHGFTADQEFKSYKIKKVTGILLR